MNRFRAWELTPSFGTAKDAEEEKKGACIKILFKPVA
jgi:hypothetical protein